MSLLEKRLAYKPFKYPWAFTAYELQNQMHWIPSEVPLHDDVVDWNQRLSQTEKNLLTQIFRFFTQGDIDVAQGYIDKYMPLFKPTEIRMMLCAFAAMEATHIHAYSILLDTVGIPETEYEAFAKLRRWLTSTTSSMGSTPRITTLRLPKANVNWRRPWLYIVLSVKACSCSQAS
jgi:ribonucleoside-diphosphate reductase beta chain